MSLATVDTTPITVKKWTNQLAAYTPILAHTGGTVPAASVAFYVFPDGTNTVAPPTAPSSNVIAAGTTDATGKCSPVELRPGDIYRITTADGSFTSCRFSAGSIVGQVLLPGDNVTGA